MNKQGNQSVDIIVTGGPQTGASLSLENHHPYRIGSDPAGRYDVLLRTPDDDFSLVLDTTPGNMSVLAEFGYVAVDGRQLDKGEKALIKSGELISASNVEFHLKFEPAFQSGSQSNFHEALERHREPDALSHATLNTQSHTTIADPEKNSRGSGLAMFAAGLLLTGGSATALYKQQPNTPSPQATYPPLSDALSDVALPDLEIIQLDENRIKITGLLKNTAEQQMLKEVVAGRPEVIQLATKTENQMLADIKEFYRINGISASVERSQNGQIKVATKEPDLELLNRVEAELKTTGNLYGALTPENNPPVVKKKSKSKSDINKQVLMVVAGENPYVMTRNGGRYFVGSVLPNGQTIVKIDKNNVTLVKGQVESLIEF